MHNNQRICAVSVHAQNNFPVPMEEGSANFIYSSTDATFSCPKI